MAWGLLTISDSKLKQRGLAGAIIVTANSIMRIRHVIDNVVFNRGLR